MFVGEDNKVAIEYIKLLKNVRNAKTYDEVINPSNIYKEIIMKHPNKKFGRGQQDSGEGLHLFLDAIDNKELSKLFMYKYVCNVWCINCRKNVSSNYEESCVMEIPLQLTGLTLNDESEYVRPQNGLNSHIKQYVSDLDDYTCSICKLKKCCMIYQLSNAPVIITVMFNKFNKKIKIDFPESLHFTSHNNTNINYRIVSKIEHIGSMSGGHYYSECYRNGEPVDSDESKKSFYELNDSIVSKGSSTPTRNSYFVFYHNI